MQAERITGHNSYALRLVDNGEGKAAAETRQDFFPVALVGMQNEISVRAIGFVYPFNENRAIEQQTVKEPTERAPHCPYRAPREHHRTRPVKRKPPRPSLLLLLGTNHRQL